MSNLSREQEQINRNHNAHQSKYIQFNPDCPECIRQRNWQPRTRECNWCTTRLPLDDNNAWIAHTDYHAKNPESMTK